MKNPDYPDTLYITELVVADTVNTMPEKTLRAYADHGEHPRRHGHRHRRAGPGRCSTRSRRVGVDLTDVFHVLENEGVEKFEKSWADLLETVKDSSTAPRAERHPGPANAGREG